MRRRFLEARSGRGPFRDREPDRRPHIVFITVDMVPPDVYRPEEANGGLVHTPNLDALRQSAVTFTNAFSNSPLCGPSRASYLTGRYPYVLVNEERAHDGWAVALRPDDIIFPEYLRAVGYVTKHVGKSHVGAAKFTDAFGEVDVPWNRWAPPMTDDDGYVAHLRRLGLTPPVWPRPIQGLRPDRRTPGNVFGGFVTQADGSPFPEEGTYPHYLAALAADRLEAALEQGVKEGAPLYLQVDFFAPHQPFMIPAGCEERAEELRRRVRVPESFYEAQRRDFGTLPGEPYIYQLYRRSIGIYDEEVMREYIVSNLLQMEVLDRAIGKVLDALRERGLYDEALIIFCADHGEMNGERALVDKGVYGHPRVARVPLVVKPPSSARHRAPSAAVEVDVPVCLLDLAPTVLEAAGIEPEARLDGLSLRPLLEGGSSGGASATDFAERTFIFEACWHVAPNPAVALQWRRSPEEHYFYTFNLTSAEDELYDLTDTTYRNLAGAPEYGEVRRSMLLRLAEFLRAEPRWRCYWHTLRLARAEFLPPEPGDQQMFRPE